MRSTSDSPFTPITEHPLVLILLIIGTIYAVAEPLRNSLANRDYGIVTVYVVVIGVVVLAFRYVGKLSAHKIPPLTRNLFKPFERLDRDTAWPRRTEQRELIAAIERSRGKPVLLVGDSGVGKSVLVDSLVIPALKDNEWKTLSFDNYSNFKTQMIDGLQGLSHTLQVNENGHVAGLPHEPNVLVVFDQFEQFLSSYSANSAEAISCRNWLYTLLQSITKANSMRSLIVVRREWYYDLRFLAEFAPAPTNSVHLLGLRPRDAAAGSISTLRLQLSRATNNEDASDAILRNLDVNGEVSPVEAQIVGCMLENRLRALGEITSESYSRELGGKDKLIPAFFDTTLRSSPNRDMSLEILFALSIENRYRRQLTLAQLVDITHKPRKEVIDCLEFLHGQRFIYLAGPGQYQLSHDYLAERFHELSGSELDPKQRDNILFFGDEARKDHAVRILNSRPKLFTVASDWFMAFLAVLVVARLTGPLYGVHWGWFNHLAPFGTSYAGMDTQYLPVAVSHLAWSYYVTMFYRRCFVLLKERRVGRCLALTTLVTCTASVVLAVFIPYFWIFSIGFGGLWIGAKLLQLSMATDLSAISRDFFRVGGWETIVNVSFPILLGGAFGVYVYRQGPSMELARVYILVSIPAMALLTYAMYIVARRHIARRDSAIWLGMFDRRLSSS